MADTEYECNPTCLPCENTAQLANSVLSYRTAVLDLLCRINSGAGQQTNKLSFADTSGATQLNAINAISSSYTLGMIEGNGSSVTLSSTPSILPADVGTILVLVGLSNSNSVTLQSDSVLSGSALFLGAATRTLGLGDTLMLLRATIGWVELSFSNN